MDDRDIGMLRTPVQARSQDSTDRMLDAAIIILDRAGLAGLTIAAVGKEAGVGTGTIYHRFRDRRAVLIAAQHRFLARLEDEWLATAASIWCIDDDDEFLLRLLEAFGQSFAQHRNAFRAFMITANEDPELRRQGTASSHRFASFLIDGLTRRFNCSRDVADSAYRIMFSEAVLGAVFTPTEVSGSPADPAERLGHLKAAIRALLKGHDSEAVPNSRA